METTELQYVDNFTPRFKDLPGPGSNDDDYMEFVEKHFNDLINYYIQKFKSIPEDQWLEGQLIDEKGRCCALGHCGCRREHVNESKCLHFLFRMGKYSAHVDHINDGVCFHVWVTYYKLPLLNHPKARILQFLNWLKNGN